MNTEKIMQHLIGKTYPEVVGEISIKDDQGDCCGFADYEVNDGVGDKRGFKTAILHDVVKIDYDNEDGSRVVVNFIFDLGDEKGLILGYDLSASSGSGWSYGAYCQLKYGNEVVAEASF